MVMFLNAFDSHSICARQEDEKFGNHTHQNSSQGNSIVELEFSTVEADSVWFE